MMNASEIRYRQSDKYKAYRRKYDKEYRKRPEVKLKKSRYAKKHYQNNRERYQERNRKRVRSKMLTCTTCGKFFIKWDYLKTTLCCYCRRKIRVFGE